MTAREELRMWTLTPGLRRWADAIWHRWPTWLAIALTVLTADGGSSGGDSLARLSDALLIFGLNYVVLSLLQWRRATWLVVLTLIAGLIGLRLQSRVDPTQVLLGAAVAL